MITIFEVNIDQGNESDKYYNLKSDLIGGMFIESPEEIIISTEAKRVDLFLIRMERGRTVISN